MKLIFLFLATVAQLLFANATDLNEYLDEKLRQSKIEFIKIHIQGTSPVKEKSYKVHWNKLWRVPLTSEYQPFIINMFDGIFILDGNRVMASSVNQTHRNETYEALREVDRIEDYSAVKFVRSIVWRDITYMLVCYELDLCSIYTATPNKLLRFRHTIGHTGIPVDAKFFVQANKLHLVIANNADRFSVPSIIYRWSGTYMDVVSKVATIGAISVTAFEHRRSTIVVFAQSDAEDPRVGSEVYEFKDNNIVRIQFLSTSRPISMHHYVHGDFNFILMINELGPSSVFCWDGRELLDWFNLSDIDPHSLISTFHMDGDTFVIAANDNIIQLDKFHSTSDWKNEDVKRFKDNQRIVDMAVSMDECTMIVVLVIQERDVYSVEQWEAELTSISSESSERDADATREYLSDLIEKLQARMPAIREAEASWKILLPFAKNLTISEPMRFDNLILQSGTIDNIDVAAEEGILPPHRIKEALDEIDRNISDVVVTWMLKWQRETKAISDILDMSRDKIMADDVFLEELEIDQIRVDFVNDANMRMEKLILPEGEQHFTQSLHVENLIVHDLDVDSLCGIPFQYWTLRSDRETAIVAADDFIEYSNDTVTLHSNLTVGKLKIENLNGINVDRFIDDLFIVNRTQKINGTITYTNPLFIVNLTTQMLNGIPTDQLLTTTTSQSFDDFYIKILEIDDLHAETINGVPVEQAARKSRENVIRGKLKLANLYVTENLAVHTNASMINTPDQQNLQIYENVTITGDLHLRNIKIERTTALSVEDVPINVNGMFDDRWTKSSDQTITEGITLESGCTIDKLDAMYLNGFAESDFLYTTVEEIPSDFTNLLFEDFHVDEFLVEGSPNDSFFQIEPNVLTIRRELRLQSLRARDIITLVFNDIDVNVIMNGTRANLPETMELSTVRARRVIVENLDVRLLNGREVLFFENGLRIDDDHQMGILKIPEFRVRNLMIDSLNGIDVNLLTRLKNLTISDVDTIIVDGDLIAGNLLVDQVDGHSTESFLKQLARNNITIILEKYIGDLIVQNITLESLHGRNFDDFIASVLTKSKEQTIPEHFSAHVVNSDNVTTNFINEQKVSQLMWIDGPLTITGNVTFSDLFVEGDVITSRMNERDIQELYDSLLLVPAKNIDLLKADEGISWDTPLAAPASISYLLQNAVINDKDQEITGRVIFLKDVHAWAVTGRFNEIEEIRRIVSDVVIDYGEDVEINGKKFFEEDLVAESMTVNGDLGIVKINDANILVFNDSVFRKDREDTIIGPLTFTGDVAIEKLRTNNTDLDASIGAAVRSNDVIPRNVFFEELEVLGNVYLKNLDGIDFDKFVSERVTLNGNHEISCDVRFNGIVAVMGNANIGKINQIRSSDFVLSDVNEMQIIHGVKTFKEDLIIEGGVNASVINDIDITMTYRDGVQNDGDVDIFGDLIFKANVRIRNMSVSGLVNDVDLRSTIGDLKDGANEIIRRLMKNQMRIERNIGHSSQMSETLRNVFFYLEVEEDLKIPGINVSKIDMVHLNESAVRFNVYSEQPGNFCGLPDDCSCVYQSAVEILNRNVRKWQVNPGEIVRNFHDPSGTFGVNVMTNAVSSNEKCISTRGEQEFTTISLKRSEDLKEIEKNVFDKIEGYLKDAKIFTHNGDVYIILAIYYDKTRATHRANTLVYKVHLATNNSTLVQKIPTDGAWILQIFKIDHHEMFLLIGCFGESSESLLYRFDPMTQKFEQLRTFASRSRHVRSLSQGKDYFILLDNPDANAVNVYKYNHTSRNFYSYQNIFHARQIKGIECFYTDDFGNSDVFVIIITQGGRFYIYEYMFAGMKLQHAVDGLRTMVPFYYMERHYILAGTDDVNRIFRIVKQGPH